jgi:hypothetical protein
MRDLANSHRKAGLSRLLFLALILAPLGGCSTMESVWDTLAFWRDDPGPSPTSTMMGQGGMDQPAPGTAMATGGAASTADMAQIKSELARLDAERQWVEARIKELKSQLPAMANAEPVSPKPVASPPVPPMSAPKTAMAAPAAAPAPLAAAGDVFGEAPSFGLHLASYRKAEDAVRGWAQLRKAMPDLLGDMQARTITVDFNDGRGAFIRLKAGPLGNKDMATKKCAEFTGKGQF